ncbi:MAG: VWA domain-containing protein [Planctomycetes bacterium]|nr:VWA domain-containing protein [Planctomycetota bacterium]
MRRASSLLFAAAGGAFLLAAALLWPRVGASAAQGPTLVLALVDASADVVRNEAWLPWARAELRRVAQEAEAQSAELAVLSYADGVALAFAPGAPQSFLAALDGRGGAPFDPAAGLARGATRLRAALLAAEPLVLDPQRRAARVLLLARPSYTEASPAGVLSRLGARGVALEVRPPPRAPQADLGLLALELPARVEPGAPLVARARFLWSPGAPRDERATVTLTLEQGGALQRAARALALPAQGGEFELPLAFGRADGGRSVLRAEVALASGPDLLRENDRAAASTLGGAARALGVLARTELRQSVEAWLGRQEHAGLEFVYLAPDELGAHLAELSALVSVDLAPEDLPAALVEAFVLRGGGWLATGGWRFLARWTSTADAAALAALLPCEPPSQKLAPRDVLLLVDGSGSMEGAPFEGVRAAALALVGAVLPGERLALRFFTSGLEPEHVLKERSVAAQDAEAVRRAARELLALRVPNGTTHLLRSLRALPAAPAGVENLVLVLSDGREREAYADEQTEARAVRRELEARRTQLAVIAVGEGNFALLAALAGGAENVRSAATPAELATLLQRELAGARVSEGELELTRGAAPAGSLTREIQGADGTALAPLRRYVKAGLRPQAEALVLGPRAEPVLAVTRAGLGRSAWFAAPPASDWTATDGAELAIGGLLRWLARGPDAPPPRARLEGLRVSVSALADGEPELSARVLETVDGGAPLALQLFPPSELGADARHTRVGTLARRPGPAAALCFDTATGEECLALEETLPDEFSGRERPVPSAWLQASTAPPPAQGRLARSHPAGPWVLALALLLLLAAGLAQK